jgi:hypothetical protein
MSVDRFYAQCDGKWKKLNDNDLQRSHTDFWVDLAHGGNALTDERYYFESLADAQEFYLTGWEQRQFMDDNDEPVGLDHSGLYSRGRLIHGTTIHGDEIGHEGEGLRRIVEKYAESLGEDLES